MAGSLAHEGIKPHRKMTASRFRTWSPALTQATPWEGATL